MRLPQNLRKFARAQQGFTLVEMLVVAPLVLIVLAGLVTAMITMVGDSLAASGRASVSYNIQDALDRIEQDSRVAINFMGTFSNFTTPQGRDGGTGAFSFSSNKDLIITEQATTASPYDSTRSLVYYANQPSTCTPATGVTGNRVLVARVVYFLRNGSLWRRTIVNPWNLSSTPDNNTVCSTPWQRDTCPSGSTVGNGATYTCNGIDEELLKNVTDFTPTFYTLSGATTSDPSQAATVSITVTTSQSISGETVSQTSTLRATRRNDVPETPVPDAPVISVYNPSVDTYNNPIKVSYQWSAANATAYSYQTSTNGTTWTTATPTANTYTSVAVAYGGQPAYIRVTAYNDQGSSSYTQFSSKSSVWTTCSLQNGWEDYPGYGTASYTITSAKVVVLRGLIQNGTATIDTVLCSLPNGFKPDKRQLFQTASSEGAARVDVQTNGDVTLFGGSGTWVSLNQVKFIPSGSGYTWSSDLATINSWAQFSASDVSNVVVTTDNLGRKHIRGLVKDGTITNGSPSITLPAGYAPDAHDIYGATGGASNTAYTYNAFGLMSTGVIQSRGISATNYWSIQAMWWPSGTTGWTTTTLTGWPTYDSSYSSFKYKKGDDGIVSLRGLVKNGTMTNGTVVLNLPEGFRPTSGNIVCAQSDNDPMPTGFARVEVTTTGDIVLNGVSANGFLSLAGCDFYAG